MTTFTPNNPIIPLRMGIRHDPPTIALVYKRKPQDIKERIYSILLNGLVELSDSKLIALKLFEEHALILNENIIDMDQVENLVGQLQRKYEERKQASAFKNPLAKHMISPIHSYQPQNNNPYNIHDNDVNGDIDNTTHYLEQSNIKHNNVNMNQNNFNHNYNSTQGDSFTNDQSYQQSQLLHLQTPNQQDLNDSPGYNPNLQTQIGSVNELKRQKVKNKNEKNKQNLEVYQKNGNDMNQLGDPEEQGLQQYMNSNYNFGQRKKKSVNDVMDSNNINQNEFIDQEGYNQNLGYNEDYHNVMDEDDHHNVLNEDYHNLMNDESYPYGSSGQNTFNNQQIQIPPKLQNNQKSQQDMYAFQNTPIKGYIDTQIDYQDSFNPNSDSYCLNNYQNQNNYQNNNKSYFQSNQNAFNPIKNIQNQNAPFFSKRQSITAANSGQAPAQEHELIPSQQQSSKRRRNKLNQLKELANMHRENEENMHDDQLEVI